MQTRHAALDIVKLGGNFVSHCSRKTVCWSYISLYMGYLKELAVGFSAYPHFDCVEFTL